MKGLADETLELYPRTLDADPETVCEQRKGKYDLLGEGGKKTWLKRRLRTARRHPSGLDGLCGWEREEAERMGLG